MWHAVGFAILETALVKRRATTLIGGVTENMPFPISRYPNLESGFDSPHFGHSRTGSWPSQSEA